MTHRSLAVAAVLGVAALGCADLQEDAQGLSTTRQALSTGVNLIAIGSLDASGSDLSAETAAPLENGVPGNAFGGLGSGLGYAGGNRFFAVPDRGPNAVPYNAALDNTTSYLNRYHTLKLALRKAPKGSLGLPYTLEPELKRTTLFFSPTPLYYSTGEGFGADSGVPSLNTKRKFYLSGRSDNFDPSQVSTFDGNGRFDPESIRMSNDGEHVYVSDEYGPYVYEFARSGMRTRTFTLPDVFAAAHLSALGDAEISGNTVGRVANKGMEGLAITPDGKTLVGAMQSPLLQDNGTAGRFTRIVTIDIESGQVSQYAYELTNIGTASKPKYPTLSDIVAINAHEFLVDERDGKGLGDDSTAVFKKLFHIDLAGAVDVSELEGEAQLAGTAVSKTLFLDLVEALTAQGMSANDIPAKIEGIAFGPDIVMNGVAKHTLFIANDNDFLATVTDSHHPAGIANPNLFFVFGIDLSVLPGFVPQQFTDAEDAE